MALGSGLLAACGGGGGGGAGAVDSGASAFSGSAGIAAWGDSHVAGLPDNPAAPGLAAMLRELSGREVFDGGLGGQTSTQIAERQTADTAHDAWVTIFWYGGNNQTQPATVQADIARSVASLAPGNNRFVVLPVINQASPWERRGGADYQTIMDLNAALASAYPNNYLDVRSYLVGLYDPANPADVADFQDDVVPTSLRVDGIHLNAAGARAVARRLLEFLAAKGW